MVFTSLVFLFLFLGGTLAIYYLTPRPLRAITLTACSFVFYGWWRPDFVLLMLFSASVDFIVGGRLHRSESRRTRKLLLVTSCVVNLGLLGYFKYADFGIETLNLILTRFEIDPLPLVEVVLPVGISFYTFQSMSYTIDIYRGQVVPTRSFPDFLCYVSLFPQLVAGPIVRYRDLADQLRDRSHTLYKFATGTLLFQMGFVKKVLIADTVGTVADRVYGRSEMLGDSAAEATLEKIAGIGDPGFLEAWVGTIAYGYQIYFDFSGYSDMAIGLGLMMGFVFPINFDSPYQSKSITEFWRRWHISLSTWLRDYLYLPLGGNRKGPGRTYVNLMTVMLLGGLWHGANFTFVAWGAYQGLWLVAERLSGKRTFYAWMPSAAQVALTFLIAMGGWVFFRADSLPEALEVWNAMLGGGDGPAWSVARLQLDRRLVMITLSAATLIAFLLPPSQRLVLRGSLWVRLGIPLLFLVAVLHTLFQSHRPFLYFQF